MWRVVVCSLALVVGSTAASYLRISSNSSDTPNCNSAPVIASWWCPSANNDHDNCLSGMGLCSYCPSTGECSLLANLWSSCEAGWVSATAKMAAGGLSDREILEKFYHSTGGPQWKNNKGWLTGADISAWYGVDQDEASYSLDLHDNQLTGSIPAELGQLSQLKNLALSNNELTGSIPAELGQLSQLGSLSLHDNELTGSIPAELGQLSQLENLSLGHNELTGSIPAELGQLSQLGSLDLERNQLTGSIPAELGQLSQLENLCLWVNQLTGSIPAELGQLSQLGSLNLNYNQLTGSIPAELGQLSQLVSLWLSVNQLTGSIPVELGQLSQLVSLSLGHNELTGSIPAELGQLSQLVSLDLNYNQLTGSIPAELGQLSQLGSLDLSVNQLTGSIPAELGQLSRLDTLDLHQNQLRIVALDDELQSNLMKNRGDWSVCKLGDNDCVCPIQGLRPEVQSYCGICDNEADFMVRFSPGDTSSTGVVLSARSKREISRIVVAVEGASDHLVRLIEPIPEDSLGGDAVRLVLANLPPNSHIEVRDTNGPAKASIQSRTAVPEAAPSIVGTGHHTSRLRIPLAVMCQKEWFMHPEDMTGFVVLVDVVANNTDPTDVVAGPFGRFGRVDVPLPADEKSRQEIDVAIPGLSFPGTYVARVVGVRQVDGSETGPSMQVVLSTIDSPNERYLKGLSDARVESLLRNTDKALKIVSTLCDEASEGDLKYLQEEDETFKAMVDTVCGAADRLEEGIDLFGMQHSEIGNLLTVEEYNKDISDTLAYVRTVDRKLDDYNKMEVEDKVRREILKQVVGDFEDDRSGLLRKRIDFQKAMVEAHSKVIDMLESNIIDLLGDLKTDLEAMNFEAKEDALMVQADAAMVEAMHSMYVVRKEDKPRTLGQRVKSLLSFVFSVVVDFVTLNWGKLAIDIFNGLCQALQDIWGILDQMVGTLKDLTETDISTLIKRFASNIQFAIQQANHAKWVANAGCDKSHLTDGDVMECFEAGPNYYSVTQYHDSPTVVHLTVRGSTSLEEWLMDFDIFMRDYNGINVHSGFLSGAQNVFESLRQNGWFDKMKQASSVVLSGHSLGGAVVEVLAKVMFDTDTSFHKEKVQVFTFGAPKPVAPPDNSILGSWSRLKAEDLMAVMVPSHSAEVMMKQVDTMRFVHADDPVPKVPLNAMHFQPAIHLYKDNVFGVKSFVSDGAVPSIMTGAVCSLIEGAKALIGGHISEHGIDKYQARLGETSKLFQKQLDDGEYSRLKEELDDLRYLEGEIQQVMTMLMHVEELTKFRETDPDELPNRLPALVMNKMETKKVEAHFESFRSMLMERSFRRGGTHLKSDFASLFAIMDEKRLQITNWYKSTLDLQDSRAELEISDRQNERVRKLVDGPSLVSDYVDTGRAFLEDKMSSLCYLMLIHLSQKARAFEAWSLRAFHLKLGSELSLQTIEQLNLDLNGAVESYRAYLSTTPMERFDTVSYTMKVDDWPMVFQSMRGPLRQFVLPLKPAENTEYYNTRKVDMRVALVLPSNSTWEGKVLMGLTHLGDMTFLDESLSRQKFAFPVRKPQKFKYVVATGSGGPQYHRDGVPPQPEVSTIRESPYGSWQVSIGKQTDQAMLDSVESIRVEFTVNYYSDDFEPSTPMFKGGSLADVDTKSIFTQPGTQVQGSNDGEDFCAEISQTGLCHVIDRAHDVLQRHVQPSLSSKDSPAWQQRL